MFSEQGGDAPEVERQDHPDEDAGPAVEPVQGDQGPQVSEQVPADATGSDPDNAVRTSAPAPEAQSGVPQIPDGTNEGVEPQPEFAGPVEAGSGAPEEEPGTKEGAEPTEGE
jgi:hypothetical protein